MNVGDRAVEIVELTAGATHPLRRSVLRDGTPSDQVVFDGDDAPTTFHLGARVDDRLVAISTWIERPYRALPALAYQLRGMATDPAARGGGVASAVLHAGIERCRARHVAIVWARARVDAIGFYARLGFATRGVRYTDEITGMLHVDIVRHL